MKTKEFDYVKKDGEKSHRKVMIMMENTEYIDALDLDKLEQEEIKIITEALQEYEKKLEPFVKKSFRRFSKSGMSNVIVEKKDANH